MQRLFLCSVRNALPRYFTNKYMDKYQPKHKDIYISNQYTDQDIEGGQVNTCLKKE